MKIITFLTILFTIAPSISFAIKWDEPVKGTNMTRRELWFHNNMIQNSIANQNKKEQLKGVGTEFSGNVEVSPKPTDENPNAKEYKVFVRGCGKVVLNEKDEKTMKEISSGTRIKLKFKNSRDCQVSDWSKF